MRDCSTLLGAVLVILLTLLTLQGCCSGKTASTRPTLPLGRPDPATAKALATEFLRHYPTRPGETPPERVSFPPSFLFRVFAHLDEWRAYAKALEAAGDWEK